MKPSFFSSRWLKFAHCFFGAIIAPPAFLLAQTVALDPMTVTASRAPQTLDRVPFSVVLIPGDLLRASPSATLDGALRSVPGFSLFRRSDSATANPTAQGVSLRGLGPSGASRSLVLVDGIPLNDPFGGWVLWSKVSRESLSSAELVRGGGATAWGNAALGGVVQLLTESPEVARNRVTATIGDFSTRSGELVFKQPVGSGTFQFSGRAFSTDGFSLVAPGDRGPIDIGAASEHQWLSTRWQQAVGNAGDLLITARTFEEERGNGTPYQKNRSREDFISAVFQTFATENFAWTATAYGQDQTFSSTFSSVNAARTAETPASDQFDVPAIAYGAAWTGNWSTTVEARTSAGVDYRKVRGETRENYSYNAGEFTRQRIAGGEQDFTGVFALHERRLAENWRSTLGARLDFWRDEKGNRREKDRFTSAIYRDEKYGAREGTAFSPSAGIVWQAAPAWRVRGAAQQSFRRPTLNELYRPFRVGNVVTEANAALKTEKAASGELAVDYTQGDLTLSVAGFRNELHDAVGNVTVARGPGTFPVFGFLADGTVGRQRLNLDRIRVQGADLSVRWKAMQTLSLGGAFLYNDATIRRAALAPTLVGKRLAQVPRHSATVDGVWQATARFKVTPRLRWIGQQFEDDENQLRLGEVVVADLGLSFSLTPQMDLFLNAENLGDARVETGRSATGVVNVGTPRWVMGGIRATW